MEWLDPALHSVVYPSLSFHWNKFAPKQEQPSTQDQRFKSLVTQTTNIHGLFKEEECVHF